MPSATAASTASSRRTMPSVTEYSLCSLRWTNGSWDMAVILSLFDLTPWPIATRFMLDVQAFRRSTHMRQATLLIALAFAATAAQGQTVFRSVMPDGGIVYGDKPAPGAKEAKEISLPPPNIAKPPPAPPKKSAPAIAPGQPASESPDDQVRNAERE